jgi:hypothetical protein
VNAATDNVAYYIFKEEDAKVFKSGGNTEFAGTESTKVVGTEIYTLLYPTATAKASKLTGNTTLLTPITIEISGVTLNLNGYTLTAAESNSAIVVGENGAIAISDTPDAGITTKGTIQGVSGKPAIQINGLFR